MSAKGVSNRLVILCSLGLCFLSLGCTTHVTFVGAPGMADAGSTPTNQSASAIADAGHPSTNQYASPLPAANLVRVANQEAALAHQDGQAQAGNQGQQALPGQSAGDAGCQQCSAPCQTCVPVELNKVSLPPYVVEPPDILFIDIIRVAPRPPYRLEALDQVQVQVAGTFTDQPIAGLFTVAPEGTINLGYSYGVVRVGGLTLEETELAIRRHLVSKALKNPQVAVTLIQFRGLQQTRGEHLVRPDGTIGLGTYGSVYVTGMTLAQAKCAIEQFLSQFLYEPHISIDVYAYNSKVYYVIADGGGFGEQVYTFPSMGNETVLDAIGKINGLPPVASKKRIWVARPSPACHDCDQILPVDWKAITQGGSTGTNYQIFPGDRIYVQADCLIWLDNMLAKAIAPVERLFGITLLGTTTVQSFSNNGTGANGAFIRVP
jgi:polysaccharide export outer membrane protein